MKTKEDDYCEICKKTVGNVRMHNLWNHSSPRVMAAMRRASAKNAAKARARKKLYESGKLARPTKSKQLEPVVAERTTSLTVHKRVWTPEQLKNRREYQARRRTLMQQGKWKSKKHGTNGATPETVVEAIPRMNATKFTGENFVNAAEILKAIGLAIKFTEDHR